MENLLAILIDFYIFTQSFKQPLLNIKKTAKL